MDTPVKEAICEIGIGLLGYGNVALEHTNAFWRMRSRPYPGRALPKLAAICGENQTAVAAAADRYGYSRWYTDWRRILNDRDVQLFDNGGAQATRAESCRAAATAGKDIFCEKPMAQTADDARGMLEAVRKAGVRNQVGFRLRFVPAIRHAYDLIRAGALGRVHHFQATYHQPFWLPHSSSIHALKAMAGPGGAALGDFGSHVIDLGRFLVGEIKSVKATARTPIAERAFADGTGTARVEAGDALVAFTQFESGATGTLEAIRLPAGGSPRRQLVEITAEKGIIRFSLDTVHQLEITWTDDQSMDGRGLHTLAGFADDAPAGTHHTCVRELGHFLDCVANGRDVGPIGATFEDGYRVAVVSEAILESALSGTQVDLAY